MAIEIHDQPQLGEPRLALSYRRLGDEGLGSAPAQARPAEPLPPLPLFDMGQPAIDLTPITWRLDAQLAVLLRIEGLLAELVAPKPMSPRRWWQFWRRQ